MLCALISGILIALIVIILTYAVMSWIRLKNVENKIVSWMPTVPRVPILGSIFEIGDPEQIVTSFGRMINNPCKSCFLDVIGEACIVTKDADFIEFVLSSNKIITKGSEYKFLMPWLGEGLLTAKGSKWKSHRKAITPSFHFTILENFVDVFNANAETMVEKLKREALGKNSLDIYQYITLCTLDIIGESAMGIHLNAQENNDDEYVEAVKIISRVAHNRSASGLLAIDWYFNLTKDYKIFNDSLKIAHEFTNSVIDRKKKERAEGKGQKQEAKEDALGRKPKKAFLDMLLNSNIDGQPLTREQLREEVDTFMFAGHDTTSSSISSALYLLANRPDLQKQLREELKGTFDNKDSPITHQDLQGLKYLEILTKETLRLYPPAPIISRLVEEDAEFKGHIIPKGTVVNMSIYHVHRDPDYFDDAETFLPERFMETATKHAYAFIPFSAGPRNCIGQKFAMLEMKTLISKMVMNFEILPANPPQEMDMVAETIYKAKNGVNIRLKQCEW